MFQQNNFTMNKNLSALVSFIKQKNLKETALSLKRETGIDVDSIPDINNIQSHDASSVLSVYSSEDSPDIYEDQYIYLKQVIEAALDIYKAELSSLLYPVFAHLYLELICNDHLAMAQSFFARFKEEQEWYFQAEVVRLASITSKQQMIDNQLVHELRSCKYVVSLSRDTYQFLKRQLEEKQRTFLMTLLKDRLYVDVYDGITRNKEQVDATSGSMIGESTKDINRIKIMYGLFKEPDIQLPLEEEEDLDNDIDKPKKKKSKKDFLMPRKSKTDPNAPPFNRVPLPELREMDKLDKINALRDAAKRIQVGTQQHPSVCFATVLHCSESVTCVAITDDTSLLAVGFRESFIKVWTLTRRLLRTMKSAEALKAIDLEDDKALERILDEGSASDSKLLYGHQRAVYGVDFSPDKMLLVSASADSTVRLWSLFTFTNLTIYRGHMGVVWDVQFCKHGYYFVSSGHDKTARLWATDHYQPVRIFAGHFSDVDCVEFHPNSNYIATGGSDKTLRLWDVSNGKPVRLFSGHKGSVIKLRFSVDGRFLASSGLDNVVILWDLAHGTLIAELRGHSLPIYSMDFDRDGNVLATGAADDSIKIWDVKKVFQNTISQELPQQHPQLPDSKTLLITTYYTKSTPVQLLHFTRRNLLIASGCFNKEKAKEN